MSRDQILADLETARNSLSPFSRPWCPFSTFYSPMTSVLLPIYLPTGLAPFHRSLGNSLSREFRGSLSLAILVFYRDGRALPRMLLSFSLEEDRHLAMGSIFIGFCKLAKLYCIASHVPRLGEILMLDAFLTDCSTDTK